MIKLEDGWIIDADKYNFILGQSRVDKDGKTIMANATYHRTIGQAIERYYKRKAHAMVASEDMVLEEAVERLGRLSDKIYALRQSIEEHEYNGGKRDD